MGPRRRRAPRVGGWLVRHPLLAPFAWGTTSAALAATDTPTDWPFVAGTFGVMTAAVFVSGMLVRRRVKGVEFELAAEPVAEPHSNVSTGE
jgi:hypothetical protein